MTPTRIRRNLTGMADKEKKAPEGSGLLIQDDPEVILAAEAQAERQRESTPPRFDLDLSGPPPSTSLDSQ